MEDRSERPRAHATDVPGGVEPVEDGKVADGADRQEPATVTTKAPTPGRVRIAGLEAGVAAGLVTPADAVEDEAGVPNWPDPDSPEEMAISNALRGVEAPAAPEVTAPALPDWRDPPTREVPAVLLQHPDAEPGPTYPGPVWREDHGDWDDEDLTFAEIVQEGTSISEHGLGIDEPDPFGFDFPMVPAPAAEPAEAVDADAESSSPAEEPVSAPMGPVPPGPEEGRLAEPSSSSGGVPVTGAEARPPGARRAKHSSHRARVTFAGRGRREEASTPLTASPPAPHRGPKHAPAGAPSAGPGRNPVVATVTGLAVGGAVVGVFYAGPPAVLALVTLALLLAAAECYQALRRAHFSPAVLVGLLGVAGAVVASYEKGPEADIIAGAAVVVAALCWYLFGVTRRAPVVNFSVTVMTWAWIGLMGSFAALLIAPTTFPHRHGLAYLLGAIIATVAYDVGGYAFGSWIGTRRLAPSISPNKTVEGLFGGCFAAIAISVAVVGHLHPWTVTHALELGIVVAVFAPLGDLAESMMKRDLGVKDMGSLLPAHGGFLDRVDGMLFVLPATYCLVRLFHG